MSKAVVPSSIVSEVLEGDNYEDWSKTIEAYLKAQDLWDVVMSYQRRPKKQFKAWEKKNAAALHAIRISCGTKTLSFIRGFDRADIVWETLREWLTRPRSSSNNDENFVLFEDIETTIADEENVNHELEEAYKELDDAFSQSNLSYAIRLLEKYPLLLTKILPYDRIVFNELMKLGGRHHDEKVTEILRSVPYADLRNYLSRSPDYSFFFNKTPLQIAVRAGAIEVARCLVQRAPEVLVSRDTLGLTPLATAIGFHKNEMADMLYNLTPNDFWTSGYNAMDVFTKCVEAGNSDLALKLLKSIPEEFILKDFNGKSLLKAAASTPHLFRRRTYHHRFLPKYICKVLGPRLPLGSINFEISGMELLIHLGNAIRYSQNSGRKIDIVCEALFEAIKHENLNFILMLINSVKRLVYAKDDKSRNMYMLAITHRHAKLFSLLFWDKQDEAKDATFLMKDNRGNNILHMVGASTPLIAFDRISKPAIQMKRELMWFKEVEKLVPDSLKKSRNLDGKTPHELFNESHKNLVMEKEKWMKDSASPWAGPLIITIMFAAAFQVPGGSLQDKGYPVFLEEWLFKVYMVVVSISLFSATISVLKFLEIISANNEDEEFLASLRAYSVITGSLFLSLATMLVAFCTGLFLTLHGELTIFLPIAAIATFMVGYIICTKLPLLAESLNFFTYEKVKIPFNKWRASIFDRNIGHEVDLIFKMLNSGSQQRR